MTVTKLGLVEAIDDALNILGSGECSDPSCQGCVYERRESKRVLIVALARVEGAVCEHCDGQGYEPVGTPEPSQFGPDRVVWHHDTCVKCGGLGYEKDYLPPSWRRAQEYARRRDAS
jgi:hypothetical protein